MRAAVVGAVVVLALFAAERWAASPATDTSARARPAPVGPAGPAVVARPAVAPAAPAAVVVYSRPVAGAVVRPFVPPPTPYAAGHRGVDLSAAAGEVVRAAAAGIVRFAGPVAARGVLVIGHADGITTEYEPVRPLVRTGAAVRRGQPVAVVSGRHAGCLGRCVHWGARRGEVYLDPLALLRPLGPVVLLPWPATGFRRADARAGNCAGAARPRRACRSASSTGWRGPAPPGRCAGRHRPRAGASPRCAAIRGGRCRVRQVRPPPAGARSSGSSGGRRARPAHP